MDCIRFPDDRAAAITLTVLAAALPAGVFGVIAHDQRIAPPDAQPGAADMNVSWYPGVAIEGATAMLAR